MSVRDEVSRVLARRDPLGLISIGAPATPWKTTSKKRSPGCQGGPDALFFFAHVGKDGAPAYRIGAF